MMQSWAMEKMVVEHLREMAGLSSVETETVNDLVGNDPHNPAVLVSRSEPVCSYRTPRCRWSVRASGDDATGGGLAHPGRGTAWRRIDAHLAILKLPTSLR
jgi:hypothetical protein